MRTDLRPKKGAPTLAVQTEIYKQFRAYCHQHGLKLGATASGLIAAWLRQQPAGDHDGRGHA